MNDDADLAHRRRVASYRRQTRQAAAKPNQIVPENTIAGNALTIVIAIMSFLACLTLGAVTLVRDASRDWQLDVQREITIQVRPVEGVDTDEAAALAASIARQTQGVAGVEVLNASENASLLEPWLGAGLDTTDLPIPRLVVVRLTEPDAADLPALEQRLQAEVQGVTLDDHRMWAGRLQAMANATVIAGLSILVLVFIATVLSVVFATRGAMASNNVVVSVLHICGAEDGFIAREFQRHFLLLGLRGGLFGAAVAALLFAVLGFLVMPIIGGGDADQVSALFGHFAVGPVGYFGALGIAFLVAIMTALTSRLTVYQHLADGD
jgi:cell division transport system permease protein